jgi:glutamate racemase
MTRRSPVLGVFDSGFGGLTVLRALLRTIPEAHYIYIGDTARLPYGAKSPATVARYAVESARFLEQRGAEMLVIACNTATALALDEIRAAVNVPVAGVIRPGVQAAAAAVTAKDSFSHPTERRILVLATAATVQSHAYRRAAAELGLHAEEKACPLLVPLVEEGWTDHRVTREVIGIYLREALTQGSPEAVLLGCTHYPLIESEIKHALRGMGWEATVIDSAQATADAVSRELGLKPVLVPGPDEVSFECFATDSVEKFQRLGSLFLDRPLAEVHLLDLGG